MNLCNNDHQEVCFEGRECPVCALDKDRYEQIKALEEEIALMNEEIKGLQTEIRDLYAGRGA